MKLLKSISGKAVFWDASAVKRELWGDEFWTDGYYIAIISGRSNRKIIENYIIAQGRKPDRAQLRLFEL